MTGFEEAMKDAGWEPCLIQYGIEDDVVEWEWPWNGYRITEQKARDLYHKTGTTPPPF